MKARFLLPIALLTACFFSCQKESMTDNKKGEETFTATNKQIPPDGGTNTSCGNWIVSSFMKYGSSSGDFNGYTFIFCSDHTVKAVNGLTVVRGGWSTNSMETGNSITYFMTLLFDTNPPDPLVILNSDWIMPEMTDNVIHLRRSTAQGNLEIVFTRQG